MDAIEGDVIIDPWLMRIEPTEDGFALTLAPARAQVLEVAEVSCVLPTPQDGEHAVVWSEGRQVSQADPVTFAYPEDFTDAEWPLEEGTYQPLWHVKTLAPRPHLLHVGGGFIEVDAEGHLTVSAFRE